MNDATTLPSAERWRPAMCPDPTGCAPLIHPITDADNMGPGFAERGFAVFCWGRRGRLVNTGQTPIQLIRDAAARSEALRRYAAAYDRFATQEQEMAGAGRYADAEGAHALAVHCLHAWRKEDNDPPVRTVQRDHDDREGAWPE